MTLSTGKKDWEQFWSKGKDKDTSDISWSKKRILKTISPYFKPGMRALEAGCGGGFFSKCFCDAGLAVTSLDYSENALEMTRKITSNRSECVQADLLHDDLKAKLEQPFDLIFSDGLFEHFSEQDQDLIFKNLKSVLSEEGVVISFVPNRWSPWELIRPFYMPGIEEEPFTLKKLTDLNVRNGFCVVQKGGVNTLPFLLSPEGVAAKYFGMLLFSISKTE